MAELPYEVHIRLDAEQTVLTVDTGTETTTTTIPTRFAQTPDGTVIGNEATHVGGQTGLDQASLVSPDDGTRQIAVENQPLAVFFAHVRREHVERPLSPESEPSETESTAEQSERGDPFRTAISVPGAYDATDCQAVAAAAEAAGFTNVSVRQRPTPLATAPHATDAVPEVACGTHAVLLDIDSQLLTIGVVSRDDDGTYRMRGRINVPGHGSQTWSQRLAEFVFEQVGEDEDATVEYDDDALAEVAEAIQQSVDAASQSPVETEISPQLSIVSGARLTAGQHTVAETVTISSPIGTTAQQSVLEDYTREIRATLSVLVDSIDLNRDSIDRVYLRGHGAQLPPIRDAVHGFFSQDVSLSEVAQPLFATSSPGEHSPDDVPVATETIGHHIGIRTRQDDTIVSRQLTTILQPYGSEIRVPLTPIDELQQSGHVELELIHPLTGEPQSVHPIVVTGIPVADDGQIELLLKTAKNGTDHRVDVRAVASGGDGESASPQAEFSTEATTPWLALVDEEPAMTLEIAEVAEYESTQSYTTKLGAETRVSKAKKQNIAEAVHNFRADLWEWTIQKENTLEPDHAKTLLRELDQALSRADVEFFVPDLGDEVESSRHYIRAKRTSEKPEGRIVDVLKPGLIIDEDVVQRADVAVAGE